MLTLEGKVAVITGGTSGIGARTASLFVEHGARVVIAGRRRDRGEEVARALGPSAVFVRTDVGVEADVKMTIEQAVARFGRLDCLVNNAGMGSSYVGIAKADLDQFDATIAVHLRGVLAAMKHAVPIMGAQGAGSIITVTSINGTRAGLGGLYYSLVRHRRCRPAVDETGAKPMVTWLDAVGTEVGFSLVRKARRLVGPGLPKHPRLRHGSATARERGF